MELGKSFRELGRTKEGQEPKGILKNTLRSYLVLKKLIGRQQQNTKKVGTISRQSQQAFGDLKIGFGIIEVCTWIQGVKLQYK